MPSDLLPFGSVKQCPRCFTHRAKLTTIYGQKMRGGRGKLIVREYLVIQCPKCRWEARTECADAKGGKG